MPGLEKLGMSNNAGDRKNKSTTEARRRGEKQKHFATDRRNERGHHEELSRESTRMIQFPNFW